MCTETKNVQQYMTRTRGDKTGQDKTLLSNIPEHKAQDRAITKFQNITYTCNKIRTR